VFGSGFLGEGDYASVGTRVSTAAAADAAGEKIFFGARTGRADAADGGAASGQQPSAAGNGRYGERTASQFSKK